MGILQNVWRWLMEEPETKAQPAPSRAPQRLFSGETAYHQTVNYAMPQAQARLFQQLSWVNAAIGAVAREVALQPLRVYRLKGEKREGIDNHDFEALLQAPNPMQSRYEFIYETAAWIKLTGNNMWWTNVSSQGAPPAELWIPPVWRVRPVPDGQMYLKGYEYDPGNGRWEMHEPWEFVHFKNFHPSDRYWGASDIEALAWTVQGDHAMTKWNAEYFDKDNAKFPGVLTFEQMVQDNDWERMQKEFKDASGGTRRSWRMLRGVGPGGVNWIQTNMSQKDMEFLQGRQFNRDEIFTALAPGLASMIAVNATEANSIAGRRTFTEMAVWPLCVTIAEKITRDILPRYGEGLVAAFDDPRSTDRALELEERRVWQTVHTVAEAREKYDQDPPLGDERDDLLVPQAEKLAASAGDSTSGPIPPQLTAFTGQEPTAADTENNDDTVDDATETQPETDPVEASRKAELATWRRYASKHGATKAASFHCDHLPSDVAAVIKARLAIADNDQEVKAAFSGPFLVKAERITVDGMSDPYGPLKDSAERRLTRLLKKRLNGQFEAVMDALGDPPDVNNLSQSFWDSQAGAMLADIRPELERLASDVIEAEIVGGIGINWDLANEAAANWAARFAGEQIRQITEVTQRRVREGVSRYFTEQGRTIGDLRSDLERWFSATRADAIAVTEVTQAAAAAMEQVGELAAIEGMTLEPIWHTNKDELVCNVCGPNDGKRKSEGWTVEGIPAHTHCRCWETLQWLE